MALIAFFSIIGWIALLTFIFKKYATIFPFVVTSSIIGILYISANVLLLYPVGLVILFGGIFLPVAYLLFVTTKLGFLSVLEKIKTLTPGFYFLLFFGIGWFIWTRSAILFGWDEFFWGQFIKVIHADHSLYTATSAVLDGKENYPPAVPLFQYFFLQIGIFKESVLYFAQGVFVLSAFAFFVNIAGRNLWRIVFTILAAFSALALFGPGLLSLTNDHIMGLPFACAFIAIFYFLPTPKDKLWVLPTLFVLPLIKVTGIVFAGTLVLAIILDLVINRKSFWRQSGKWVLSAIVALFLLTPLISMKSWDFYLQRNHIQANSSLVDISQIRSAFSEDASLRSKQTIDSFKKAIYETKINNISQIKLEVHKPVLKGIYEFQQKMQYPGFSLLHWFLIGLVIILSPIILLKREEQHRLLTISITLFVGCIAYLFVHLLVYLFSFSEFEGLALASYSRYINSFAIAFVMICVSIMLYNLSAYKKIRWTLYSIIAVSGIGILFFITPPLLDNYMLSPRTWAMTTSAVRDRVNPAVKEIAKNTPGTSKIWYIYQGSNGWEAMVVRYEIFPRKMNSWNWSIGQTLDPNDMWTKDFSPQEWKELIISGNYNYVYIDKSDNKFWERYGTLFKDIDIAKDNHLFLVVQLDNKLLLESLR